MASARSGSTDDGPELLRQGHQLAVDELGLDPPVTPTSDRPCLWLGLLTAPIVPPNPLANLSPQSARRALRTSLNLERRHVVALCSALQLLRRLPDGTLQVVGET